MELPDSIQSLLRNKPALIGVGLAGALGLFVFLRRRGSGGTGSSASTATSGTGSAGGVGTFDSTGTDIASFLGDYSQRLDDQLGGYIRDLKSTQDSLTQAGKTTRVAVREGQWVKPLVEQIASFRPGFSEADLLSLNPGLAFADADAGGYVVGRQADPSTFQHVFGYPVSIIVPAQ